MTHRPMIVSNPAGTLAVIQNLYVTPPRKTFTIT